MYTRYDEALKDRPIPVQFTLLAERTPALANTLAEFNQYGGSLELPPGSVSFTADLPGGLGGTFEGASLTLGPTHESLSRSHFLRMQVIDPGGEELAVARLRMNSPTRGPRGTGVKVLGREENGVFGVVLRLDFDQQILNMQVAPTSVAGKPPSDVLPGLRFLACFAKPNAVRIGLAHGPFIEERYELTDAGIEDSDLMLKSAEDIQLLQTQTTTQLSMPDPARAASDITQAMQAASVLRGEVVELEWTALEMEYRSDIIDYFSDAPLGIQFSANYPLEFMLNGERVQVGEHCMRLLSARLEPAPGGTSHSVGLRLMPATSNKAIRFLKNADPDLPPTG